MVTIRNEVLFLSAADLDALDLSIAEIINILEEAFRLKAAGKFMMPPKIFFHRDGSRFYSSMVSASPHLGVAGCKWQSGDPENPARGLPYIQGLYILNEDVTGQMKAVMDAEWITGQRTAAASGLVIKYLATAGSRTLGLLGCGLQGRKHIEAVNSVRPDIDTCICYDIIPNRQAKFVAEMSGKYGMTVRGASGAEEVARNCDVLVTGGPIEKNRKPVIVPEWINPGTTVVTIDYDSYVTDGLIAAMDLILTDDQGRLKTREGTKASSPA